MRGLRGQSALVVGIPLFVLLLAIGGVGELQRATDHAERISDLSDARLYTSERLLLRLVDAETGVGGYKATGDARFLGPYTNAVREVPQLIGIMAAEDPRVPADVRVASESVLRSAEAEMTLLATIVGPLSPRSPHTLLLRVKAGMDAIRNDIDRLQSIERVVNIQRRARAAGDEHLLALALDGIFLLAIFGVVGAIVLFTNRVVRRLRIVIEKTQQIAARGELRQPLRGHDEIVLLDRAVHHMADAIYTHANEIVRANRALDIRNGELSAAYRELERFSYSVSHDLRAPVRTIGSFSNRLELSYAERLDAEGRRLLGIIKSEAIRLGRLIDELLEFARLSRAPIKAAPIAMTDLARDVAVLAKSGTDRDVTITVGDLPEMNGDRVLVRQVWENLISNALKYSSAQARSIVDVTGAVEDSSIIYRVTDNGVGFDMKYAHKLFNVFERLHRADEFEGTGVGLAIVRRIIERHGGSVSATAELGAGATFSFTLPLNAST